MTTEGPRHGKDRRAPNAGHVAAILALGAVFLFLVGLAIFGAARNHLTPREIAAGCIAIVFGAVAAFWLRRESRQHGGRGQS